MVVGGSRHGKIGRMAALGATLGLALFAGSTPNRSAAQAAPANAGYAVSERWPLGGEGGWDYATVDPISGRLYLSRATHVGVVDLATGKTVGELPDTPGVHGIALAPEVGRAFVTAGKADAVKVFDLKTLAPIAGIPVGAKPDAVVYDRGTRKVVALNGDGHSASVIDVGANAVFGTIPLPGAPEFARSDGAGHVLVNLEDRNELAILDLPTLKVIARWPLTGCEAPTGLALDIAHHRSFSVCTNAMMVISDTEAGKALLALPIGHGPDGAEFDPELGNAYSSNGEGTLTVVHEADPNHFAVIASLPTARGARTIALDPVSHRLYLPTARFGPLEAGQTRPPIVPGTFEVLVVTPPRQAVAP
jgi:DNA-binding beta-propeller fold protein YncE